MFELTPQEWTALRLSLVVALASVAISLPPAIAVALLLERSRMRGRIVVDTILHLPLVVPPVVVGYVLLVLFGVHGPVGSILDRLFGVHLAFTTAGVVLATIVMTFPLVVRSMRLALLAVDPGLEDAARTLGATRIDRFFSVTLPLMRPGILAGAVLAFSASLGEFGAVITFAANIPGTTQTLPLAIFSAIQSPGGEPVAARLAIITISLGVAGLLVSETIRRRLHDRLGA